MIRRFPPPGPRGAGSPTSAVLSADSDFSPPVPPRFVLLRLAVPPSALFAPARSGLASGPGLLFNAAALPPRRWRRRGLPGSWATPARMPRSPTPAEPPAPGQSRRRDGAFRSCHSVGFHDEDDFGAQSRGLLGFLCTLRSRGRPRTTQHSVPAGWPTFAGQVFHLSGRNRRFPSCHRMHFPLRQASPGARQARPLRPIIRAVA